MEFPSSINAFGRDLYVVASAGCQGNLFLSAFSVAAALSMAQMGAAGQTAAELAAVLRVADAVEARKSWEALLARFDEPAKNGAASGAPRVRVANGIWVHAAKPVNAAFAKAVTSAFRGQFKAANFAGAGEAVRAEINQWVEDRTNARIKDLLPHGSINGLTRAIIVNALHFEAKWALPFVHSSTAAGAPFHVTVDKTVKCNMMNQRAHFLHAATPTCHYLQLQYVGGTMAMELLVPLAIDGITALEKNLTGDTLRDLRKVAKSVNVRLSLPKFTVEGGGSITNQLRALGLQRSFSEEAEFNFFESSGEPIFLSECFHKVFIRVDEEGTEAAAATALVSRASCMPPKDIVDVVVDRPSIVALTDLKSGLHLFVGKLVDPTK